MRSPSRQSNRQGHGQGHGQDHQLTEAAAALSQHNFLFQDIDPERLLTAELEVEKLYSSRPVYTAFRPDVPLRFLYGIVSGGPVVVLSTPLDRVIALTYPGGCFGMQNLDFSYGLVSRGFPSLVESYKTTNVVKIPLTLVKSLYELNAGFRDRYSLLFELQEKFQYHLLNCSTYPPQAVAALLRALVYQERSLAMQPQPDGAFVFDLPIDLIARACQLNHRTVEQVIKGMVKAGLLRKTQGNESDLVVVLDPEGLKEVYGTTRGKVSWWPLK